jgi:voltage-gated potassium channel
VTWQLPERSSESLARYEGRSGTAMFVVSLLYLSLVFVEMLPGTRPGWDVTVVDGIFWVIITLDYVWRVFLLAPDPWQYARRARCILDLIVVMCGPVLLAFIFLDSLRVVVLAANALRFVRAGAQAGRTVLQARRVYSRKSISWVIPVAILITVFLSVWIWRYEASHPGTNIHTWNDALWYAMATLMTVGYGDVVPVTPQGRIAGVLLMLVGIGLLSWITATLASVFVETQDATVDEALYRKFDELGERLAAIEARLPAPMAAEPGQAALPPADEAPDRAADRPAAEGSAAPERPAEEAAAVPAGDR